MNHDFIQAKEALLSKEYTCVLCKGAQMRTSTLRGVKPLVSWLDSGENFSSFSAADKVVGKATAFLYVLLNVKSIYAKIISKSAIQVLNEHKIPVEYDCLVEHIINRSGDGICPFENAVLAIANPQTAYTVIKHKMQEMGL